MARRKTQNLWLRDPFGTTAGASRRATCAHVRSDKRNMSTCGVIRHRPRFRRKCPAASFVLLGFLSPRCSLSREAAVSVWVGLTVVSQLLAGPRNGPGGSPAPPRVLRLRSEARRDTAPRPASRRLMRAPLRRTRWEQCKRGLDGGDKALRPQRLAVRANSRFGEFCRVSPKIGGGVTALHPFCKGRRDSVSCLLVLRATFSMLRPQLKPAGCRSICTGPLVFLHRKIHNQSEQGNREGPFQDPRLVEDFWPGRGQSRPRRAIPRPGYRLRRHARAVASATQFRPHMRSGQAARGNRRHWGALRVLVSSSNASCSVCCAGSAVGPGRIPLFLA